jgi:hypothetical protein
MSDLWVCGDRGGCQEWGMTVVSVVVSSIV